MQGCLAHMSLHSSKPTALACAAQGARRADLRRRQAVQQAAARRARPRRREPRPAVTAALLLGSGRLAMQAQWKCRGMPTQLAWASSATYEAQPEYSAPQCAASSIPSAAVTSPYVCKEWYRMGLSRQHAEHYRCASRGNVLRLCLSGSTEGPCRLCGTSPGTSTGPAWRSVPA
jgi:hypothetical protein